VVLRRAEIQKTWEKVSRRTFHSQLETVSLEHLDGTSVEVQLSPGTILVCGGNGAGKTTLLSVLARCLDAQPLLVSPTRRESWLRRTVVTGTSASGEWMVDLLPDGSVERTGSQPRALFIDPSADTAHVLRTFSDDPNVGDLREGLTAYEAPNELHQLINYVLRRDYATIKCYEITAYDENDEPWPLFEVSLDGSVWFGSFDMGAGELAVMYLLWRLYYCQQDSVIVLEEPENGVAVYSHPRLADALTYLVHRSGLSVICSSHSPQYINRFPDSSVALVSCHPALSIRTTVSSIEAAKHLGLSDGPARVLLVEDSVARLVLIEVIRALAPDRVDTIEVWTTRNGESAVDRILKEVGIGSKALPLTGVLDGDQRGETTTRPACAFLPGTHGPEEELRLAVAAWRRGELQWSPAVCAPEVLCQYVDEVSGLDSHDWLLELARRCGSLDILVRDLVGLWLSSPAVQVQADELVAYVAGRGD
jgi:hypothetical protein